MSRTNDGETPATQQDRDEQREQIAAVEEELDARSDGDGLAAEAGSGEETGLTEG